ncbi:MAG: IS630 transposase-related protein [Alphaproteobacteria bacterium]|jgi:transposase|nr:IS630 transposase-related protein [Alphaproteobacteria bacterium]
MSYSLDLRKKVLQTREEEGLTLEAVSVRFGVGVATVFRWTKTLEPCLTRLKPATKIDMDALRRDIEERPDAYQYERAQRFGVTQTGIWHALRRLKVTYKKNPNASQGGSRKTICLLPKDKGL